MITQNKKGTIIVILKKKKGEIKIIKLFPKTSENTLKNLNKSLLL